MRPTVNPGDTPRTKAVKVHYRTLGITDAASPAEVKAAFRKLALKLHPDRTGNDPVKSARFARVTAAYDILSDPDRRKSYDRGEEPAAPPPPTAAGPFVPDDASPLRMFYTSELGEVVERVRKEGLSPENIEEVGTAFFRAAQKISVDLPRHLEALQEHQGLGAFLGSLFKKR